MDTTTDRSALEGKLIPELQQIAQRLGIEGSQKLRKAGLIDAIVERSSGDGASNGPAAAAGRDSTPSDDGGSNGHRSAVDVDRPDETQRDGGNDRPQGDSDQGERQQSERQSGDRQPGDRQGNRQRNDRSQGDRQGGDRSQGDRSQGGRPQGDRPQGDRRTPLNPLQPAFVHLSFPHLQHPRP
jgi:hypothetical protein